MPWCPRKDYGTRSFGCNRDLWPFQVRGGGGVRLASSSIATANCNTPGKETTTKQQKQQQPQHNSNGTRQQRNNNQRNNNDNHNNHKNNETTTTTTTTTTNQQHNTRNNDNNKDNMFYSRSVTVDRDLRGSYVSINLV